MSKTLGPFIPIYHDDFIGGTMDMGADEVGAYLLLLMCQWSQGFVDPDPARIERTARCEYSRLRRVLSKFSVCDDGLLRNERMSVVRSERFEYIEQCRAAGIKGYEKRWGKTPPNQAKDRVASSDPNSHPNRVANSIPSPPPSPSPIPLPSPIKPPPTLTPPKTKNGGGGSLDLIRVTPENTTGQMIDALIGCRSDYTRIKRANWENHFRHVNATPEIYAEAVNAFIEKDANGIEPLKSPASYFGGIVNRLLQDKGLIEESPEEKERRVSRMLRG